MNMHSSKKAEFNYMLKGYSFVEVTVLEGGKMSEPIQCTCFEEVEALASVHGAENVYF